MLANLKWVRIGSREIGTPRPAHMIACLRNKGEDYLDFKLTTIMAHGRRGGGTQPADKGVHAFAWLATYTADELGRASSRKEAGEQMKQIANGIVSTTKDLTGERLRSAARPDASGARRPTR
jgi:hypothetical protein